MSRPRGSLIHLPPGRARCSLAAIPPQRPGPHSAPLCLVVTGHVLRSHGERESAGMQGQSPWQSPAQGLASRGPSTSRPLGVGSGCPWFPRTARAVITEAELRLLQGLEPGSGLAAICKGIAEGRLFPSPLSRSDPRGNGRGRPRPDPQPPPTRLWAQLPLALTKSRKPCSQPRPLIWANSSTRPALSTWLRPYQGLGKRQVPGAQAN